MWLDYTQETVLHHSLDVQKSALARYLKYRGWLADVASQRPSAGYAPRC
jgi:hypothetical protein